MGGGILPVALHNNQMYFLFSQEEKTKDNNKWSDFGGSREGSESHYQTAMREGYEESSGFFGSEDQLKQLIRKNKIVTIDIDTYATYIFKIDYDKNLPTYFNNNFKFIEKKIPQLVAKNGLFEKRQLRWFSINDIIRKKHMFRIWYKPILNIILQNKKEILLEVKKLK